MTPQQVLALLGLIAQLTIERDQARAQVAALMVEQAVTKGAIEEAG